MLSQPHLVPNQCFTHTDTQTDTQTHRHTDTDTDTYLLNGWHVALWDVCSDSFVHKLELVVLLGRQGDNFANDAAILPRPAALLLVQVIEPVQGRVCVLSE